MKNRQNEKNPGKQIFRIMYAWIIFNIFLLKMAVSAENTSYQEALVANATAYWKCGTNIQYSIPGRLSKSDYFAPEDVTDEQPTESDCSGFARALYMETFGIELPMRTWDLEDYINVNAESLYVTDIISQSDYTKLVILGELKQRLLSELEVGDLLVMRFNEKKPKGHVVIGYEWIYDENGEKKDMWVIHCTGKNSEYSKRKAKYDPTMIEGAVRLDRLSDLVNGYYGKIMEDGRSRVFFCGILRPLANPDLWVDFDGIESEYAITESTLQRMQ